LDSAKLKNSKNMTDTKESARHIRWPKIRSFHAMLKNAKRIDNDLPGEVVYRGKIKLHGQNVGITIQRPLDDDCQPTVSIQSRNHVVDNCTLAGEVVFPDNVSFFTDLWGYFVSQFKQCNSSPDCSQFTIFGEWCGKGIQKHAAISTIDEKVFAIFAIDFMGRLMVEPDDITTFLTCNGANIMPPRVHVLPWQTDFVSVDFEDEKKAQAVLDELDELVVECCRCDPWVQETFGISGLGEGLVLYPVSKYSLLDHIECQSLTRPAFGIYGFKAKGEQFRVVENKKSATVKVPKVVNTIKFVSVVCTEARLEQAVFETGATSITDTRHVLDWIRNDIQCECQLEMEESGVTLKTINKALGRHVCSWFKAYVTKI
jgi:hypothetical protein